MIGYRAASGSLGGGIHTHTHTGIAAGSGVIAGVREECEKGWAGGGGE